MMKPKIVIYSLVLSLFLSCCSLNSPTREITPTQFQEYSNPPPTPPGTIPELIAVLSGTNAEARMIAARALGNRGSQAEEAIPALIMNLYYQGPPDVRQAAAWALGQMGSASKQAVPALIIMLLSDSHHARVAAAEALGEIGDRSAVPALAAALYNEDTFFTPIAAESIEKITGLDFDPDGKGYHLDENGVPQIVANAIKWWEESGQNQIWIEP